MAQLTLVLRYDQSRALAATIGMMYTSGPPFHEIRKSLTNEEKRIIESVEDRLNDSRRILRERHPGKYKLPYTEEECNEAVTIFLTSEEACLVRRAIRETIIESECDSGELLEIVTQFDLTTLKEIFRILESLE